MKFDPEGLSTLVDPSEGMRAVAVHLSVTIRSASVAHEDSDLMGRFRAETPEVPGRNTVSEVGAGILLL